jgi:excisionase family DNA binding protein
MKNLTTLDDLATDPSLAKAFSSEEVAELRIKLGVVQGALQLQAVFCNDSENRDVADRLLTVKEVADRLGCKVDWLYRESKKLPFTRKLSGQVRFSEKGLKQYIDSLPHS